MKKLKNKFGDIKGFNFSVLGFGAGATFNPPPEEREIILRLINKLADRRILLNGHCREISADMCSSLIQIRESLTNTIEQMPESEASNLLIEIRRKCHSMQNIVDAYKDGTDEPLQEDFHGTLRELRELIRLSVLKLSEAYEISLESGLAKEFL